MNFTEASLMADAELDTDFPLLEIKLIGSTRRRLPALPTHQQLQCANCGGLVANPRQVRYPYSTTRDPSGKVIDQKSEVVWTSECCTAGFMVWDHQKDDNVDMPDDDDPMPTVEATGTFPTSKTVTAK